MAKNKFEKWLDGLDEDLSPEWGKGPRRQRELAEAAWNAGAKHGGGGPTHIKVEASGPVARVEFVGCPFDFAARLKRAFE